MHSKVRTNEPSKVAVEHKSFWDVGARKGAAYGVDAPFFDFVDATPSAAKTVSDRAMNVTPLPPPPKVSGVHCR